MHSLRSFIGARDGTILVFWAISLAAFLGLTALSFDMGRMASTQSELQSFADNVALAAAGELNGGSDALTRADAAAARIADTQTFAGGRDLDAADYTLTFHSALPDNDLDAMASLTTDPVDALYVRVVIDQHTLDMPFAAAFSSLSGNAAPGGNVAAEAVAGFTQWACDVTPLMFCLPGPDYRAEEHVGDMILLRSGGGGGTAWGPGNFGFIDLSDVEIDDLGPCDGLSNVQLTACLLGAQEYLTQCFSQRGIDTKPGQNVGNLESAINVRFDIYKATMTGKRNDAHYEPAPNVVKGTVQDGGSCKIAASPDTLPLPRDACFATGLCDRFGDGAFDWSDYVAANHSGLGPAGTDASSTRYEMYLAEIAAAAGDGISDPILPGKAETGRPHCASTMSADPKRRVVIAAGVDCTANPVNGSANDVPVEEFFELFLTEPAGASPSDASNFDIWAEVIGSAGGGNGAGDSGIIHDVVQLYR